MNKLKGVLLGIFLLSGSLIHAQLMTIVANTDPFHMQDRILQIAYWTDSMVQMVENAKNTYNQLQATLKAQEMAIRNLRGITDVNSWDDFMNWYNRQLYLKRQAEQRFNRIGVKIGNKNYNIKNVADIPDALREQFVDYWDKEFTEEQRREMWLRLGMTPANYAYTQTWRARMDPIMQKYLTRVETQNEEYMKEMERNKEILDRMAEDRLKPDDDKMGEKELLSIQAETLLRMNKTLNDMGMYMAEDQELKAIEMYQARTVHDAPPISESWDDSPFAPLERTRGR